MPEQTRLRILVAALLITEISYYGGASETTERFYDTSRDGELKMTTQERYEYWESLYSDPRAARGKDWYGTWAQFKDDIVGPPFNPEANILVAGCGVSALPVDVADDGFHHVTAADYSKASIRVQRKKYKKTYPAVKWIAADMRHMPETKDMSYDVIIEKALLDGEGAFGETSQMIAEIARILRPGGRYVSISLGPPNNKLEDVPTDALGNFQAIGIYFSASWCPPCKQLTPVLIEGRRQIRNEYGEDSFEVVLVSRDRSRAAWMDHLSQLPWLSLIWDHDAGRMLRDVLKVTHLPRLVVMNSNGRVICENARGGNAGFGFCCDPLKVYAEILRLIGSNKQQGDDSDIDTSENEDEG